jgi:hypothetical protein
MIFKIENHSHCNKAIISGVVFCIIPDTNMANPPRPIRPSAKTYKSFFLNQNERLVSKIKHLQLRKAPL